MKKKVFLFFIVLSSVAVFLYFNNLSLSLEKTHASGGRALEKNDSVTPFLQDKAISNDISEAWNYIGQGDLMMKASNFPKAIDAYKQAYAKQDYVGPLPGLRLIEAYESNEQFDQALILLDELAKKYHFKENKHGLQKFDDIRSRLLAAKAQAAQ